MAIRAPIRGWWMRVMRLRRVWLTQLRQPGALPGLLLASALALGGPLICVLHCEIWLPLAQRSSLQQHSHHHHAAAANGIPIAATGEAIEPVPGHSSMVCSTLDGSGPAPDTPLPLPPSPVHEMIAALNGLLAVTLLILLVLRAAPRAPPFIRFPPPLRPPIPFAG